MTVFKMVIEHGGIKMKKETNETIKYEPCCECGKKKMRQTTLGNFMDILPKEQKKLDLNWTASLASGGE